MEEIRQRIIPANIEEEMKESYLDYSMSVIVARALPDVRDGLKPVHRRVLYGMHELGLTYNKPYKKSARVVGEVLGKYHPHGDSAVYDTMVRMVQDFSMRYPLVDGQGNFGSVDGDSAAAMRYTEVRMAKISQEILKDIDKDTVNFRPNFDETLEEPEVMPSRLPLLLMNGASGIAVGMATNIPPHNLTELVDALIAQIDNPEITIPELMQHIKGPDFPTGGIIMGMDPIKQMYETGRGKVIVRARANVETGPRGKDSIVVTELPYQVNKANLISKIADLVNDKKLEGISDLRDESDRDGMRIVIELKKDAVPEVVLNNLYKHTQMQTTFGVINLALVDGIPQVMNLKELLSEFIKFRHEVILRRTRYELKQAEHRAHILEGYRIALDNIDEVIHTIRNSQTTEEAKQNLMKKFGLSEIQAKSILEMRLQRLTGLERDKIEQEYREVRELIAKLKAILEDESLQFNVIKEELLEVQKLYGDERRTEIIASYEDFEIEDMIAEEEMVITVTHNGFIKRFPVSGYRRQNRGGRGASGTSVKEEDWVEHLFIASTHNYLLFFTSKGRCHWLKVHAIPQMGRASRGRAIVNLLQLSSSDKIQAILSVKEFSPDRYVFFVTEKGTVKKTSLEAFGNPRRGGINAINLREDDNLVNVFLTEGNNDIIIGTNKGLAIRFNESEVRDMGRTAAGVTGIRLKNTDYVVGALAVKREGHLLSISQKGFGKRTHIKEFRLTHRGGKGIIAMNINERVGDMINLMEVVENDEIMLITQKGVVIRMQVNNIRVAGRNTMGVKLIRLDPDDKLSSIARIISNGEDTDN
ncbi:MAG: DNA gyrase subunit A [Calditrichia bacterium]